MTVARTRKRMQIDLLESNPLEARLINYFRNFKLIIGSDFKSELLRALRSFFNAIAMADDPLVSDTEVEAELMNSLIAMLSQMSAIVSYCRIKRGIKLTAEMFATFGLKPESNCSVQLASLAVPPAVVESKPPVKVEEVVAIEPDEEEEEDEDEEFERQFLETLRNPPPLMIDGQIVE